MGDITIDCEHAGAAIAVLSDIDPVASRTHAEQAIMPERYFGVSFKNLAFGPSVRT